MPEHENKHTQSRQEAGRKGGQAVSRNREHMAEIGRKGGVAVSSNRQHMSEIGRKGGQAVSSNREHMAQIGRKGGQSRGGGSVERQAQHNQTDRSGAKVNPIERSSTEAQGENHEDFVGAGHGQS